ncbi:MAG TPA: hypothetical protein PKG52_09995 [bacterium]|nr:hypothetical protein [bacterium]HPS30493.1 hypothetical protein [bacterium]
MSDAQTVKINSLDSKIKDISDYLKSSVLDPANEQKSAIISEAKNEAAGIIEKAKNEAASILKNAKKESEAVKLNTESALKIAAKQSVDKLKMALEKEVLAFSVTEPVKSALKSEQLIKEFISEVIKQYSTGSFSIAISDNMKKNMSSYIESQIAAHAGSKITLSKEILPSGFSVIAQNGVLRYDFTEESVIELLIEYLRPELRKSLFSK